MVEQVKAHGMQTEEEIRASLHRIHPGLAQRDPEAFERLVASSVRWEPKRVMLVNDAVVGTEAEQLRKRRAKAIPASERHKWK